MSSKFLNQIKRLVFTSAYVNLYPLSEKEGIVDKINTYDYNQGDEFCEDINSLYLYLLSDLESNKLEQDRNARNLDMTYKTKKIRHKDKETNLKTIEKVKIERKRSIDKEDRANYSKKLQQNEEITNEVETLADRLTNGTLTESDLPLLDKTLKRNRIRTSTYIAGVAAIAVIIALLIIF